MIFHLFKQEGENVKNKILFTCNTSLELARRASLPSEITKYLVLSDSTLGDFKSPNKTTEPMSSCFFPGKVITIYIN